MSAALVPLVGQDGRLRRQHRDCAGPAPAGHRYVRVAADILLIAVGTSMVIDAIQDLGSR